MVIEGHGDELGRLESTRAELQARPEMEAHVGESELDRAARLRLIERQGDEIGQLEAARAQVQARPDTMEAHTAANEQEVERRTADLRARIEHIEAQWAASEQDRAARLSVIEALGSQVDALRRDAAAARDLLQRARLGSVLRMARALRPHGVDAALARAIAILDRTHETRRTGDHAAAASPEPPPVTRAQTAAKPTLDESLCAQIRDPKTTEPFDYTSPVVDAILRGLSACRFDVDEITIDPAEYRAYFEAAGYTKRYPEYYSFNLPEKSLEHFLAAKLLDLGPNDVYIDIASEHSPVPEIYARLFGCSSYRQDLDYPEGVHGHRIGGDAAAMPVPDAFATKMALHCSFEHFEGDSDSRFIREVERVLRTGGRVCFAPIYLCHEYAILTDPAIAVAEHVPFEDDAVVYCRPGWQNRHGRLYDAPHLDSRIRSNLGAMRLTIARITNAKAIDPSCYIQFAGLITKP